jgi:hypothetical protein
MRVGNRTKWLYLLAKCETQRRIMNLSYPRMLAFIALSLIRCGEAIRRPDESQTDIAFSIDSFTPNEVLVSCSTLPHCNCNPLAIESSRFADSQFVLPDST